MVKLFVESMLGQFSEVLKPTKTFVKNVLAKYSLNVCFFAGLLGPTALSVNTSTAPNSLLNALNSSVSPLQSPSSGTHSPTLWATSLANTNATGW